MAVAFLDICPNKHVLSLIISGYHSLRDLEGQSDNTKLFYRTGMKQCQLNKFLGINIS